MPQSSDASYVRLLERISDVQAQLERFLQDLKVLEFIYERSFYPELSYMFKHALTHDVAYNSLLMQRRKGLHRLVAIAIEELYAERLPESYEMLAYHYERGEVWEKALEYLVKAGQKAQQAYANQKPSIIIAERWTYVSGLEKQWSLRSG